MSAIQLLHNLPPHNGYLRVQGCSVIGLINGDNGNILVSDIANPLVTPLLLIECKSYVNLNVQYAAQGRRLMHRGEHHVLITNGEKYSVVKHTIDYKGLMILPDVINLSRHAISNYIKRHMNSSLHQSIRAFFI